MPKNPMWILSALCVSLSPIFLSEAEIEADTFVSNSALACSTLVAYISGSIFSTFNAILGVANLCTTVVGFVIINKNLNKISSSVQEVLDTVKNIHDINVNYKFQEVISEYKNMLDKKRYDEIRKN